MASQVDILLESVGTSLLVGNSKQKCLIAIAYYVTEWYVSTI